MKRRLFGRLDPHARLPTVKVPVRRAKGVQREEAPTIESDFLITWKLRRDDRFANVLDAIEALPDLDRFDLFKLIISAGVARSLDTTRGRPAGIRRKDGLTPAIICSLAKEAHRYWIDENNRRLEVRRALSSQAWRALITSKRKQLNRFSIKAACAHVIDKHLRADGPQKGWPGRDRVIRVVSEAVPRRAKKNGDKLESR